MQSYWKSTKNFADEEVLLLHTRGKVFNDPDFYVRVAQLYEKGEIVERDLKKAVHYYKRAVGIGSRKAAENLANFYEFGAGKRKRGRHVKKIAQWWLKAAELGSPEGMRRTASNYRSGLGLPMDNQKACEWNSKLAKIGNVQGVLSITNSNVAHRRVRKNSA